MPFSPWPSYEPLSVSARRIDYVSENWPLIGLAIRRRMAELELSQSELIHRAHVSKRTAYEILHCAEYRRRNVRTLQALSVALEWHPDHLQAVLAGATPPRVDSKPTEDQPARLAAIEITLRRVEQRVTEISTSLDRIFRA